VADRAQVQIVAAARALDKAVSHVERAYDLLDEDDPRRAVLEARFLRTEVFVARDDLDALTEKERTTDV